VPSLAAKRDISGSSMRAAHVVSARRCDRRQRSSHALRNVRPGQRAGRRRTHPSCSIVTYRESARPSVTFLTCCAAHLDLSAPRSGMHLERTAHRTQCCNSMSAARAVAARRNDSRSCTMDFLPHRLPRFGTHAATTHHPGSVQRRAGRAAAGPGRSEILVRRQCISHKPRRNRLPHCVRRGGATITAAAGVQHGNR